MLENLKKYWFLLLIVIMLVVGTVVFSKQQIDSSFKGKKVNGKDIVFEVNGENINADDYYAELLPTQAGIETYKLFERYVLSELETSDEIKKQSKEYASNQVANTSAKGTAAIKELEAAIIASGYTKGIDDLATLYENQAKLIELERQYITDNQKDVADSFIETNKPRVVSHILIRMEDPTKPTDAEQKKLDDAKKALADGDDFGDVAMKYSDDTGTASVKGSVGYMDKNSKLVQPFIDAAIKVDAGEQTEWFNSEFGQHIVLVEKTSFKDLIEEDEFVQAIATANQKVQIQSVVLASKDLDIEFVNKDVEALFNEFIEGGE